MVDSVNSLTGPSRPVAANKAVGDGGNKPSAGTLPSEPTVQISEAATTLSSLYEAANAFVQKTSIKPLTGSSEDDPRSYYLNVEKYNDHIFDQAASSVVVEANKAGIQLNKDDVTKQLRDTNNEISSYTIDMQDRESKLTPDNLLKYVSKADLDNITDFYIASKDKGLPDVVSLSYAVNIGVTNQAKTLGIKYASAKDYLVTDDAIPPGGIPDTIAENAKKLYGHFGLSNMAVNALAASFTTPTDSSGRQQAFNFLLEMLGTAK